MKSVEFGAYIKAQREEKRIPQRIVAHALNVDTSTLSKMELGERQILISQVKPLSEILNIDFKALQIKYISDNIISDFSGQPYLKEALKITEQKI
ncbi:helix-turn-helix transcriptional regulator [Lentimicrobium sp. L6]|uniref:helix-turn-helix domain-containing protein n=1 Tax=Lentimicrobium sp. L6 TaxID=2735916 RepID=UPI00155485EA|nr:helix-turn-helix transcriptional regulator [Lentimicrobium sp. L6]NPD86436.1 helix-turn-helix transcriptional regulator [Lentimicrobium sp. L6]